MEIEVRGRKAYAYTGGRNFDPNLPTVVCIHGAQHDHSVWGLQSRYLAHHGFGVLALDLPGHGRSGGAPLTRIEDMAEWLISALDASGVKAAALIGHSMGALVALECAARYPQRIDRIALLAIAFPMRVSAELLEATQKDEPMAHAMINAWSHAAYAQYPSSPGPGFWVRGGNLRLMQRQKPGVLYTDFAACDRYTAGLERAARIECPALLLLGERDMMTPAHAARDLAQAIPSASVITITGSGHDLMAEKPDEVLDALVAFLRAR